MFGRPLGTRRPAAAACRDARPTLARWVNSHPALAACSYLERNFALAGFSYLFLCGLYLESLPTLRSGLFRPAQAKCFVKRMGYPVFCSMSVAKRLLMARAGSSGTSTGWQSRGMSMTGRGSIFLPPNCGSH